MKTKPEEEADAEAIKELAGDIDPPKRGAPKKDPALKITKHIRIGLTESQYWELMKLATAERMDLDDWAKELLLLKITPQTGVMNVPK